MPSQVRKKKQGMRKVKKMERMRRAVEIRHENRGPEKPSTDSGDIYPKHIGRGSDASRKKGT